MRNCQRLTYFRILLRTGFVCIYNPVFGPALRKFHIIYIEAGPFGTGNQNAKLSTFDIFHNVTTDWLRLYI